MKSSHKGLLRVIAVFKLLKASILIALGVGVIKLLRKDVASAVENCVELLRLDPNSSQG
jgi:Predicted membrane protein (DUF2127)